MGSDNVHDFANTDLIRFIEKVYVHPLFDYAKLVFELYVQNDVAVAMLKTPFSTNEFIQTIRLPDSTTRLCKCGTVIGKKRAKSGRFDIITHDQPVAYTSVHPKRMDQLTEAPTFSGKVFYSEVKWYKGSPLVGEDGAPFICYQEYEPILYGIVSTYYNNTRNRTAITLYENVKKHLRFINRWVPLKPTYKILKIALPGNGTDDL